MPTGKQRWSWGPSRKDCGELGERESSHLSRGDRGREVSKETRSIFPVNAGCSWGLPCIACKSTLTLCMGRVLLRECSGGEQCRRREATIPGVWSWAERPRVDAEAVTQEGRDAAGLPWAESRLQTGMGKDFDCAKAGPSVLSESAPFSLREGRQWGVGTRAMISHSPGSAGYSPRP